MNGIKKDPKRRDISSPLSRIGIKLLLLTGSLLLGAAGVGGCAMTEVPTDAPAPETTPEADLPEVRLPSIRLSRRSVVPIASLMADRADDTVAVSGTVAEKVAVLDGWLYQVQDESGGVWVLSDGSDPTVGEAVTVEGVVRYEEIVVDDIDAGEVYLEERAYQSER